MNPLITKAVVNRSFVPGVAIMCSELNCYLAGLFTWDNEYEYIGVNLCP